MPVEELAGTRISWRDAGEGRPVLLLHCTHAHGGAWRDLRVHLPGRHVVPDLPAHGRSGPAEKGRDILVQSAEAMTALLERVGMADVVGHSFGAVVALRLALDRPDLVRRLALYEPVLFAAAKGTPEHEAHARKHEAIFGHRDPAMRARAFHAEWGGGRAWEELPQEQRTYILERADLPLLQRAAISEDATGILAPGGLEGLGHPVLLTTGADSPPVVGVVADRLAGQMADARRETLPGMGHMGPITHAETVAGTVAPFLAG